MSVTVNMERMAVEISWDPLAPGTGDPSEPPDLPPEFPEPPELPDAPVLEKILSFLFGNLPEYDGPPIVQPVEGEKGGFVKLVRVFAEGQDGDWSNTSAMPNDGKAVLTYPDDFSGESYVEVRDAMTGNVVDSGTIQVGG